MFSKKLRVHGVMNIADAAAPLGPNTRVGRPIAASTSSSLSRPTISPHMPRTVRAVRGGHAEKRRGKIEEKARGIAITGVASTRGYVQLWYNLKLRGRQDE